MVTEEEEEKLDNRTTILEDWRTGGEEDKRTMQYDRRIGRE